MKDPLHSFTVEQFIDASPEAIFRTWTANFDTWFATPGQIAMVACVGEPYWFEVRHNGERYPHYGKFLTLVPNHIIEQTWVSGKDGTGGAETVVRIELELVDDKTRLLLTHSGFYDGDSAKRHADSWPQILAHLSEIVGTMWNIAKPPSSD